MQTSDSAETRNLANAVRNYQQSLQATSVDLSPIGQYTPTPTNKPTSTSEVTTTVDSARQTRKLPHRDEHDREEHARFLEQKLRHLLLWETPLQTVVFSLLTAAISVNLVYVNATIRIQKMLSNCTGVNPYSTYLQNTSTLLMDRIILQRNTEWIADKMDGLVRKLSLIMFIENSFQSFKWLLIFYATWNISTFISLRGLTTFGILILFSWPPLYTQNKSILDCHFMQLEAICNTRLERLQENIEQNWSKLTTFFQISHYATPSSPTPATIINNGSRSEYKS